MVGSTSLEVYNSISRITEHNSKFELYTDTFDKFSFLELKDELEEILDNSNTADELLQDERKKPRIFSTYKKLKTEKRRTNGNIKLIMGYAQSPFRDFESYLRIVVGLDERDIQLILKQYNSIFLTYERDPGIYRIEDLQKAIYFHGGHEGTLQIEYDDISMKTKFFLTRFGGTFGKLRFDEKSFFDTLLGFTPFWNYKPTNAIHADSSRVYTSDKNLELSSRSKIHSKCDVFDGSIQNGLRHPILFSFVLDEKPGFKVFCEPETIHYKS